MSSLSPSAAEPLRRRWRNFLRGLTLSEVSGAFGDLGTFLPLLVRRRQPRFALHIHAWMTGLGRRLHMQMVCSSCVEIAALFFSNCDL